MISHYLNNTLMLSKVRNIVAESKIDESGIIYFFLGGGLSGGSGETRTLDHSVMSRVL